MAARGSGQRQYGDVVVLRYITTDGRIEMCWPCRVVEDRDDVLALLIAAGSPYKAAPKRTAAEKRRQPRIPLPPGEYVWRNDTLRLMPPLEVTPELSWRWRDEEELANHVAEGFYTAALATAARLEGEQTIEAR